VLTKEANHERSDTEPLPPAKIRCRTRGRDTRAVVISCGDFR